MKRLLMLGGADIQVSVIRRAVELGHYVITCDNRPENPGHEFSHEYHEVSTTDIDAVCRLAEQLGVDGVLAYASDPAALTAAYVAERLGLPGDPLKAVRTAQDKLALRKAQADAGLPTPEWAAVDSVRSVFDFRSTVGDDVLVKPVDASGSKGVTLLSVNSSENEVEVAVALALAESRSRSAIVERRVHQDGQQIGGDVLVLDGLIREANFGDQVMSAAFDAKISIGSLAPTSLQPETIDQIVDQIQDLVDAIGLCNGIYNVEIRVGRTGPPQIIDFGARIGGNFLGVVHTLVTGVDFEGAAIAIALGQSFAVEKSVATVRFAGYLVIHAQSLGKFKELLLSDDLLSLIDSKSISVRPGDVVRPYRTSADRLGVLVITSDNRESLDVIYRNIPSHLRVELEDPGSSLGSIGEVL